LNEAKHLLSLRRLFYKDLEVTQFADLTPLPPLLELFLQCLIIIHVGVFRFKSIRIFAIKEMFSTEIKEVAKTS